MYCTYLLGLFLLVGVDADGPTLEIRGRNDQLSFNATYDESGSEGTFNANFEVDPETLRDFQLALNQLIERFLEVPQVSLSLRSTDDWKTGVSKTIRAVGDAISNNIHNLAKRFGFGRKYRSIPMENYKLDGSDDLKVSTYYQLLRFPLELSPVTQDIYGHVSNHMKRNNYVKMGYKPFKVPFEDDDDFSEDLKVTAFFGKLKTYCTNIYNCLDQKASKNFDLKAAIGKLMNNPPEVTGKILKSRLSKPIPYNKGAMKNEYSSFDAFVCHATTDVNKSEYSHCLQAVKTALKCGGKKPSKGKKDSWSKKSLKDFIGTIKDADDGCTNINSENANSLECKLKRNVVKSNEFPQIMEFLMGDLTKFPALRRMATALGSSLKSNQMGSEAISEIAEVIDTYKYGKQEKANLMRAAQKNSHSRAKFIKISNNLKSFEEQLAKMTFKTFGHLHGFASTAENILVDSALKGAGEDLSENVKFLKSWSTFMDSVFNDWSRSRQPFPVYLRNHEFVDHSVDTIKSSKNKQSQLIKVPNKAGPVMENSHTDSLKNVISSLKRLGEHSVSPRRSTALISIANSFLLATAFYECIAVLAASIYRDTDNHVVPEGPSFNDFDLWMTRETRSLSWVNKTSIELQESENTEESFLEPSESDENEKSPYTDSTETGASVGPEKVPIDKEEFIIPTTEFFSGNTTQKRI